VTPTGTTAPAKVVLTGRSTDSQWEPLPGQSAALASGAYELFFGGAAGPGKSTVLVVTPLRWVHLPTFRGLILRNSFPELKRTLIAKSHQFYRPLGATYHEGDHVWTFPSGAQIEFSYLERDVDCFRYQGAELQYLGWDELPHFTEYQYRYMQSRLRSSHGVPIRLRSTGNPDGKYLEWVRKRFAPWIEKKVPAGKALWFDPDGNIVPKGTPYALSRTYIPGKLSDNPYLTEDYKAQLMALDPVTRAKLMDGDWDAVVGKGSLFHQTWWVPLDAPPPCVRKVRAWDFGASKDGDPTVGLLMGDRGQGVTPRYVVLDVVSLKAGPTEVHKLVKATAMMDGPQVLITIPQDPGAAGKDVVVQYQKELTGWHVKVKRPDQKKIVRAGPFSSQVGSGQCGIVRGPWTPAFISEMHAFPEGPHDDQVDAASDAFSELALVNRQGVTEDYYDL